MRRSSQGGQISELNINMKSGKANVLMTASKPNVSGFNSLVHPVRQELKSSAIKSSSQSRQDSLGLR